MANQENPGNTSSTPTNSSTPSSSSSMSGASPASSPKETSAHDGDGVCASCGRAFDDGASSGIEALLARIGISEEMVNNLKSSVSNIDIEQYLTTARDYLKDTGGKAKSYTKENPGKVAAGVAAVALGAGLLITALGKDKD